MAGTGGALKALTKNLANQLTLNRSEMKRVVARVISERHGQGDVGDYNGHMFFVKPERIDLTEQITHSKEAFDDMIQQKRMRLCSSRHNLYRSPSHTRSRSLKMTMRSPAANKSLTGVIIDQRHLPKRGNPPEIVVQIAKGKSRSQSKRVPVTLSPPPVRAKTSLRRLPSRSKSLLIGSKAKLKVGSKKRPLKAKFTRSSHAKKSATASNLRLHELHKQHQRLQQQLKLQEMQEQQQAKLEQQMAKLQPPESTPNNGQRLEAGAKATLAVEKAQSLVEELANSSVTLCHEKSMAAVQPVVIKKKSNNLLKKKYSSKLLPKSKSKIISRKKKLYPSNNSNNNVRNNYNSNNNRSRNNNNNNNNHSNSNNNRNKIFGNKSYRNNNFGFRNAGNRLQAGGLMAEASKLGIRTPAIDRYTKYWRHPYQFPGGAGATQMYDTAREKYAAASAKAKLLVRRKQVAAALYTNFQRQQQSSMNLRRIRKKQSRARLLRQMKRDEAIDDPDNLEALSSKRCLKRRKRSYKISPRLEALAKPVVHRTKLKATVHRHNLRQEVSIPSSLGSMANLKRGTSRSGLTPAKRNLTLAFFNREESGHSPRSRRSAIWR